MSTSGELFGLLALSSAGSEQPCAHSSLTEEVTALFDETRHSLLRYLLSFDLAPQDSEEVLQEIFLALFRHLLQGKPRTNLRAWLFRVAHNLGLKQLMHVRRDSSRVVSQNVRWEDVAEDPTPSPEKLAHAAQVHRRLQLVLKILPERDRRCLVLRAEGLRYREIADVLDISLGSVSNSIARSLARMTKVTES